MRVRLTAAMQALTAGVGAGAALGAAKFHNEGVGAVGRFTSLLISVSNGPVTDSVWNLLQRHLDKMSVSGWPVKAPIIPPVFTSLAIICSNLCRWNTLRLLELVWLRWPVQRVAALTERLCHDVTILVSRCHDVK